MNVDGLLWGEDELAPWDGTEHFLVVGATGSGKTLLIHRLLNSVFGDGKGRNSRALIYDSKQDIVSTLYAMGLGSRIRLLHPFDRRGCAWDLAKDIDGPLSARQIAAILIPDSGTQEESGTFFHDAVRDLLTGVILAFINCTPKQNTWTFRDIILTMMYEEYLDMVLSWTEDRSKQPFPIVHRLRRSYLDGADDRTRANVRSTINTTLSIYEPVAAVWQKAYDAGRRISLAEWNRRECNQILVLGNDEAARAAIDPINQALFRRATELLLSRKEHRKEDKERGSDFSWIFLDEIREAGRLDGLSRLLNKGRSKGVCIVLGFQDIDGLRAVYGEEVANELTGQCENIALLQMSNPSTAEWATSLFGRYLARTVSSSTDIRSDSGLGMGKSYAQDERSVLYSRALLSLPKTGPERGLTGYYRSYHRGSPVEDPKTHAKTPKVRVEDPEVYLDWDTVLAYLPPRGVPDDKETGDFVPGDLLEQYLRPWDADDWERLGLKGAPPSLFQPEGNTRTGDTRTKLKEVGPGTEDHRRETIACPSGL